MVRVGITIIRLKLMLLCLFNMVEACTAFSLVGHNGVIIGKNLDWPIGDGFIIINQKNKIKFSMTQNGDRCVRWKSKYGSITFDQLGRELPLGGMNEAGLVVEELSYSPTRYTSDNNLPVINEFQWIQYQLDNFASVHEVIAHLPELRIDKLLFGMHYFLCDCSGNSAVVEFIDGKIIIYIDKNLPHPVLSNNSYENSLTYLRRYRGFGDETEIIYGRNGSQERFVYATDMISRFNAHQQKSFMAYAFNILNKVKQADTQWSITYDPQNLEIWFHIKDRRERNVIQFKEISFESTKIFPLLSDTLYQTNQLQFLPYSHKRNSLLLDSVFTKLIRLNEIDKSFADSIQKEIDQYLRQLVNPKH
jgi:penicillin V acylase-like amidase (Ntn superfamily)